MELKAINGMRAAIRVKGHTLRCSASIGGVDVIPLYDKSKIVDDVAINETGEKSTITDKIVTTSK
jgi:hypothetical protein